ncbi:MAG: hypothetical protein WB816_07465 [Methylocystis sp.]
MAYTLAIGNPGLGGGVVFTIDDDGAWTFSLVIRTTIGGAPTLLESSMISYPPYLWSSTRLG